MTCLVQLRDEDYVATSARTSVCASRAGALARHARVAPGDGSVRVWNVQVRPRRLVVSRVYRNLRCRRGSASTACSCFATAVAAGPSPTAAVG